MLSKLDPAPQDRHAARHLTIVSGGQTGVDRAAWDAAFDVGY